MVARRKKESDPGALRDDIRTAGLRATASRIAVLGLVRGHESPLTHGEVFNALSANPWDKATIYRNLVDLSEVGLLHRTELGGAFRFEGSSDPEDSGHVHFVCVNCERVQCLPHVQVRPDRRRGIPRAMQRGEVEIQVRGVCDRCS